jgi:hypothetical protein
MKTMRNLYLVFRLILIITQTFELKHGTRQASFIFLYQETQITLMNQLLHSVAALWKNYL